MSWTDSRVDTHLCRLRSSPVARFYQPYLVLITPVIFREHSHELQSPVTLLCFGDGVDHHSLYAYRNGRRRGTPICSDSYSGNSATSVVMIFDRGLLFMIL